MALPRLYEALGDTLASIVSNSHLGKRPGALGMTIFVSHSFPHVTDNIFLLLKFSEVGDQAISRADFVTLIIVMWVKSPILFVPSTEGGIFEGIAARGALPHRKRLKDFDEVVVQNKVEVVFLVFSKPNG